MEHTNISNFSLQPKATVSQAETCLETRYHYLDNIRALAMFAGILFHASLAYSPLFYNLWFTSGNETSASIDIVGSFIHLFRMPIFFLVSGFFAIMLLQKRGIPGFLKNRAMRILLPFILFFPILATTILLLMGWAMENIENLSPMLQFVKTMPNNPDAPPLPLSTMHLWFLFNLFLFALTTSVLYKFNFFQSKWIKKISSAKFILLVLPLLMVPAMLAVPAPHPAAEKFYPELWSFGFYGLFFILGSLIFFKQSLLDELEHYENILLVVSIIAFTTFYSLLPTTIPFEELMTVMTGGFEPTLSHLIPAICEATIAVYMTIYCLLLGRKFLNKPNKTLKLISDSSYWVYLIHMPILLMIQFALTDIHMNMWFKFFISTSFTFLVAMLSYLLLVRWTPIGWLLNGRKKKTSNV
jgi:surface polysaccharide O-acyltransferase-like enzyme